MNQRKTPAQFMKDNAPDVNYFGEQDSFYPADNHYKWEPQMIMDPLLVYDANIGSFPEMTVLLRNIAKPHCLTALRDYRRSKTLCKGDPHEPTDNSVIYEMTHILQTAMKIWDDVNLTLYISKGRFALPMPTESNVDILKFLYRLLYEKDEWNVDIWSRHAYQAHLRPGAEEYFGAEHMARFFGNDYIVVYDDGDAARAYRKILSLIHFS